MCFRPAGIDAPPPVCPECGTENLPTATKCVKCGYEVPKAGAYFVPGAGAPGMPSPPGAPGAPAAPGAPGRPPVAPPPPGAPGAPKAPGL